MIVTSKPKSPHKAGSGVGISVQEVFSKRWNPKRRPTLCIICTINNLAINAKRIWICYWGGNKKLAAPIFKIRVIVGFVRNVVRHIGSSPVSLICLLQTLIAITFAPLKLNSYVHPCLQCLYRLFFIGTKIPLWIKYIQEPRNCRACIRLCQCLGYASMKLEKLMYLPGRGCTEASW